MGARRCLMRDAKGTVVHSTLSVCDLVSRAYGLILERHRLETIALDKPVIRAVSERLCRDGDVKTAVTYPEAVIVGLGRESWVISLGVATNPQPGGYVCDLVAFWYDKTSSRRNGSMQRCIARSLANASDHGYSILVGMHNGRLVPPYNSDIGHTVVRNLRLRRPSVVIDGGPGHGPGHEHGSSGITLNDEGIERRYTKEAPFVLTALTIRSLSTAHRNVSGHRITA